MLSGQNFRKGANAPILFSFFNSYTVSK